MTGSAAVPTAAGVAVPRRPTVAQALAEVADVRAEVRTSMDALTEYVRQLEDVIVHLQQNPPVPPAVPQLREVVPPEPVAAPGPSAARRYLLDVLERLARTAVQAALAVLVPILVLGGLPDSTAARTALIAALAAAGSLLMSLVAKGVGSSETAALLPAQADTPKPEETA